MKWKKIVWITTSSSKILTGEEIKPTTTTKISDFFSPVMIPKKGILLKFLFICQFLLMVQRWVDWGMCQEAFPIDYILLWIVCSVYFREKFTAPILEIRGSEKSIRYFDLIVSLENFFCGSPTREIASYNFPLSVSLYLVLLIVAGAYLPCVCEYFVYYCFH